MSAAWMRSSQKSSLSLEEKKILESGDDFTVTVSAKRGAKQCATLRVPVGDTAALRRLHVLIL
eukprot:4583805-Amphidinium_carterae.1